MVPLCYRSATVNGLKNPACILHAPYCDVQDANEMRMVENAKRNERHTGRIVRRNRKGSEGPGSPEIWSPKDGRRRDEGRGTKDGLYDT